MRNKGNRKGLIIEEGVGLYAQIFEIAKTEYWYLVII
jgi:hypothetical protein